MATSKAKKTVIALVVLALIIAFVIYIKIKLNQPGQYDDFAKCLTEKGVKMYGAYWCSHCKDQKRAFGTSFKYVNYIECTQKQDECNKAGVKNYPTWVFPGDQIIEGEKSLDKISQLSGCSLQNG